MLVFSSFKEMHTFAYFLKVLMAIFKYISVFKIYLLDQLLCNAHFFSQHRIGGIYLDRTWSESCKVYPHLFKKRKIKNLKCMKKNQRWQQYRMYAIHNISTFNINFRENQVHIDVQNNNVLRFSLNYLFFRSFQNET